MSWPKTTAGDSQKTMATIFFTVLDYFLFPVIFFLVHAPVSMGILDGCAVFNVSHYISFLFRGADCKQPPLFLVMLCVFSYSAACIQDCLWVPAVSLPSVQATLLMTLPTVAFVPLGSVMYLLFLAFFFFFGFVRYPSVPLVT